MLQNGHAHYFIVLTGKSCRSAPCRRESCRQKFPPTVARRARLSAVTRVTGPAEIALRERVVARALNANIETGPERHRSVTHEILLETWEQLDEGRLAAEQQRMHVPGLRRPPAIRGLRG